MPRKRHALVLGLGASGLAAARLLQREGHAVTVFDAGSGPRLRARARTLAGDGIDVRLGPDADRLPAADLCVVSPGVPAEGPWVSALKAQGVRCISEIELGWSRLRAPTLAVTGSNGKSTLVKWLADAVTAAGRTALAAGNFGLPASQAALDGAAPDWLILEVSSFQLETTEAFRPEVGILLNVLPNHLDRHGSLAAYRRIKSRLFARMEPGDTAVVPASMRATIARLAGSGGRWVSFGTGRSGMYRWHAHRVWKGGAPGPDLSGTWFDNPVHGPAAAAAAAAIDAAGLPPGCLAEAARRFQPLPHRMEPVGEVRGVRFINDSKATSLSALSAGLLQAGRPVRLIAGGLSKGDDPAGIKERLVECCRSVYLVGSGAERLYSAWSDAVPCGIDGTLEKAFGRAAGDALPGEAVLLSPGCASFDQWSGFEARGAAFRRCVRTWIGSVPDPGGRRPAGTANAGRRDDEE